MNLCALRDCCPAWRRRRTGRIPWLSPRCVMGIWRRRRGLEWGLLRREGREDEVVAAAGEWGLMGSGCGWRREVGYFGGVL
jgi:hypothetical protein